MLVSVIIPVFNAEAYVAEAVKSALAQPETGEVILIEDGSPDNSLQVCKALAHHHPKVRLLRHEDGRNHGAGASRNVGIRNAKFDYIAFLDADDFYLPGRFEMSLDLLDKYADADGVYEAIGTHFQDESAKVRWFSRSDTTLTTVTDVIEPEFLFESMLTRPVGWFSTDGVIVRKRIFDKTGYFDEHLKLCQDTAMWLKMAAVGRLIPGHLSKPVSMRRFHSENRITASDTQFNRFILLLWKTLFEWGCKEGLEGKKVNLLLGKYLAMWVSAVDDRDLLVRKIRQGKIIASVILQHPHVVLMRSFWVCGKSLLCSLK